MLFHKMKIHLKSCPEREFACKISSSCKFKSKKDEYLQHMITAHPLSMLAVSENFEKVKEALPELEEQKPIKKEEKKQNFFNDNLIMPSYSLRSHYPLTNPTTNNNNLDDTLPRPLFNDHDPYRYDENPYLDRRTFRNYLFRRKLIRSENNSSKEEDESVNPSEIADNFDHEESIASDITPNNINLNKNLLKPLEPLSTTNRTDLFKYYYNNKNENHVDDLNDENDCVKLYNQLINQNMLLKTEIIDKIKKNNEEISVNIESVSENVNKIEEEEKEIEGKKTGD